MNKNDELLFRKANEYINKARCNQVTVTNFLDLNEQAILTNCIPKDIGFNLDGGYEDATYKRLAVYPLDFSCDTKVAIIKIEYNNRFKKLSHRNVLGNLMGYGLKRDAIGDIIVGDDIYFTAKKEIVDFLLTNVRVMDNLPISLKIVDEIKYAKEEYDEKIIFSSSLRIDSIIALAFNLSRTQSQELICNEFVKVNHREIKNNNHLVNTNDLISVRTKGRIKVIEVNDKTKSGRIRLLIGLLR